MATRYYGMKKAGVDEMEVTPKRPDNWVFDKLFSAATIQSKTIRKNK